MPTQTAPLAPWSKAETIIFRFCFLYFATFISLVPNNDLALVNTLYEGPNNLLHRFIPWFAHHFFGYSKPITIFTNGSGDTTYDYLLWFFGITLTVAGTIIWSILDRKRNNYHAFFYWIRVLVRFYLFYTMMDYGIAKVIKVQFHYPSLYRMVQPFGSLSPMGLEWSYMGYSNTYNFFAGIAELSAGFLMLSRKTTTIGAIVCLAVMTNVFMVNIGFDVPVKLLAFNTILMCLFLLAKDIQRLTNFFILNKVALPSDFPFPNFNKKWKWGLFGMKLIIVISLVWLFAKDDLLEYKRYGDNIPKPPLYGIYYTETFMKNNAPVAPLQTDTTRWNRLLIAVNGYAEIQGMNDSVQNYHFKIDTLAKTAILYPYWDTLNKTRFNYIVDSPYLTIMGKWGADSLLVRLKRFDENRFRLISRGFHWVTEYPYNR